MALHGKTILTTRAAHSGDLAVRLEQMGGRVIECPAIEIEPVTDWTDVDRAIGALSSYQWILFTSANAVDAFMRRTGALHADCQLPIAVVGPATAASLERWRLKPQLTPKDFRAEGLIEAFPQDLTGTRILFPRAEIAREMLPDALRRRGAMVDVVVVYRTVRAAGLDDIRSVLTRETIDCAVFTSPSTARFAVEALGDDVHLLENVAIAVIGPVTRHAVEALGLRVAIESASATAADLAATIENHFQ